MSSIKSTVVLLSLFATAIVDL